MALTSLIIKIGAKDEEVQKALASLGKQAKTVEAELARLGTTPLGRETLKSIDQMGVAMKAVTDAHQKLADRAVAAARGMEIMGGASKLTGTELADMNRIATKGIDAFRALGQAAPTALLKMQQETKAATSAGHGLTSMLGTANSLLGAFGVTLSVGAIVGFAKSILSDADALVKFRDRTNISIEGIQRLRVAGDDASVTIDAMASAVTKLQERLGSGDKSAIAAIRDLGLNLDVFRRMDAEHQFIAISDAVRQMENPLDRARVLSDLFGKSWSELLPVLLRGFDDVRDAAVGMSADTAEALDHVGDALAKATRSFKGDAANFISFAFLGWSKAARQATRDVEDFQKMLKSVLAAGGPGFGALVPRGLPADLDDIYKKLELTGASVKRASVATAVHAAEVVKQTEALRSVNLGFKTYVDHTNRLTAIVPDLSAHIATMSERFADVREHMNDLASSDIVPMFSKLPNVTAQATKAINDASTATETLVDQTSGIHELAASFVQLAQISGESFGGLVKDIARVVAAMELGAQAGTHFRSALQGRDAGGMTAGIVGMVGAMDEATKSTSRWKATLGGAATGMKIGASIAGPYGAAVGAVAGAFVGLIRSAGAAEKAINPLREQFVQIHGGLHALNVKAKEAGLSLTAMLNAKNAQQYTAAIDQLNAAFQVQADSTAALDAAIQKYGFSIEELGPALQRQEMGKQAEGIFRDWSILNAAGINTVAIAGRMAESINTYVQQAVAMGIEVPAAMKPMLQTMIDQGQLTDAAGNKITNLEDAGISFSQTMSEGFKSVVDSVTKLAEAISGRLGTAIANIPTSINIPVNLNAQWHIPNRPQMEFAATGGLVTAYGMQHFAAGGSVLPFRRRGSDSVPAMLTPGEIILNEAQQKHVAGAMSGGQKMSTVALERKLDQLQTQMAYRDMVLPKMIRDAVLIAR